MGGQDFATYQACPPHPPSSFHTQAPDSRAQGF
jgi:hypothetical protein